MVHHVALGAEALAAVLGTFVRPLVVVNAHVDRQVVPVVEGLSALDHRTDEVAATLVVCHVIFEVLGCLERFETVRATAHVIFPRLLPHLLLPEERLLDRWLHHPGAFKHLELLLEEVGLT